MFSLKNLFGSTGTRVMADNAKVIATINSLEPEYQALSDDALRAKTEEFRLRLEGGATVDSLLPEAFAAVRESAQRTLKLASL